MAAKYEPPPGLTVIPNPDPRSDAEIIAQLKNHPPITSEKNIWAYWNNGWDTMRPWCQRNVVNWVRLLGPEWTVRVLDDVPGSDNHFSRYVPASYLPDVFNNKEMVGTPQHASDLVRLPLLYIYGGVWIDVGMFLFRHVEDICWRQIEDPASDYEMVGILMPLRPEPSMILNGFLATKKGNGMIKRWHDICCEIWKGNTTAKDLRNHPLLAHLPLVYPQLDKLGSPPWHISAEDLSDWLIHFLAFERLHSLVDPNDGFDGADYFSRRILFLNCEDHIYYAQRATGWDGRKQHTMLVTKVTSPDTKAVSEAKEFVDKILQETFMMKLGHGPVTGLEILASIWGDEQHQNDDAIEGTFGEYLRYGSVHWRQNFETVPVQLERPKKVYTVGLLDPIRIEEDT